MCWFSIQENVMNISESIAKKGFFHQKNFLTESEVDGLRELYENAPPPSNNLYPILSYGEMPTNIDSRVLEKVHALYDECFPKHPLVDDSIVFFPIIPGDGSRSINFPYHQDSESFFVCREHYYYLNAWIVIEKGDPAHSNLTVVPFDKLQEVAPVTCQFLAGNGATDIEDGWIHNYSLGTRYPLDFDLDAIAVTPHMEAGDLLLLRGDTVHKTQNQLTNRVAVSFRAIRSGAVLERRQFYSGSLVKLRMLRKNFRFYGAVDYLFKKANADLLTIDEFLEGRKRYFQSHDGEEAKAWISGFADHVERYGRTLAVLEQVSAQVEPRIVMALGT
jgi:hypothetical protein